MPKIEFKKKPPLSASYGKNLMRTLIEAQIPVARSCDGDGICAKCGVEVLEGQNNLSPEGKREAQAKKANQLSNSIRLSCMCKVLGDIKIHASYW